MTIAMTYVPVFLLVLLVFSGVTWSPADSQVVADAGGDPAIGLFSGKAGLVSGLVLVGLFLPTARAPPRSLGWALCLFWPIAFASVLWASNAGTVLFAVANLTLLLAATMVAHRLLGFARAIRLVWLFGTALILLSVALAAVGDAHAVMGGLHGGRWRGLFAHKNSFAPFLVVNLLIALFAQASLRLPAALVLAMVAIDLTALFFANSATADIAAAAGIISGIALLPIRNRALRILWRCGAIGVACVLGAVLLVQPAVTGELLGRDATMSGRAAMWAQAVPLTLDRPFGTGYGTGGGAQVSIELQKRMHRAINLSVQSGYLNLALELGWGAVALFVLWAGGGIASVVFSRRASSAQTLLAALLAAMLVESISEVNACFAPGWLLLVTMLPMIEARRMMRPRLRLLRRRYGRRVSSALPSPAPVRAG